MFCYIHIPFCENKCKYCKFSSTGNIKQEKIDKYIDKLLFDIKYFDKKINRLDSIYFGGGTPSTLNLYQLEKIIKLLENKFEFNKNIEITLETTPNKITKDNLIGWKKLGINRLSIGVQTLNNNSLIEIGRGNKGDIIEALDNIKTIGFNNVSLDFIIGLPYVKIGEVKKDINFILNSYNFIKHISVYMLEDNYYPGKWKNISIKEQDYLGEYIEVKNYLEKIGFNRYEISNYSKTGYECSHNKAYWNHSEMIAFGLGAHGLVNGTRFNYSDKFIDFYNNKLSIGEYLNNEDLFLEKLMFGLRTNGLSRDIFQKLDEKKIQEFIVSRFLKIENNNLKLEDKGVLVLDYILGEII